jgi:hypothetical protein
MRLRDIAERVQEALELDPERLFGGGIAHALVQDIREVQVVYRPIEAAGKRSDLVPWASFSFEPFPGLIEPFNVYPGRYVAMQRIHRQPSGLPELVTYIDRELPNASAALAPQLYASFSTSNKVETVIRKEGTDPLTLRFYHRGSLIGSDREPLPAEYCLPGIGEALPEGFVDDGIPGLIELDGAPLLFLGTLRFYNQGRTADRPLLRNFLLNCVAAATAARYVRDMVAKSLAAS